MRFGPGAISVLVLATFAFPLHGSAQERTAYVFQLDNDHLISIPLSASGPTYPTPTVIKGLDSFTSGSALGQDGRIISLDVVSNELIAVTPATGNVEALCTMSVDIQLGDDVFGGVDGSLLFSRQSGGLRGFYQVDPETCLMSLLGAPDPPIETVEHHQGQYYSGGGLAYWQIGPLTFDATMIRDLRGIGGACNIWGLSSVGGNLWRGMTCWGEAGSEESWIDLVDPFTGYGEVYARLPPFAMTQYLALEVIDQPSPTEVPMMQPFVRAILVLALMVAGVLLLWRR